MDDILKRMLEVEQEAERLVADAQVDADKLVQEWLQKANELSAEGQKALAGEVEALQTEALRAIQEEKAKRLREADERMCSEIEQFRLEITKALPKVEKALQGST